MVVVVHPSAFLNIKYGRGKLLLHVFSWSVEQLVWILMIQIQNS